MEQDEQKKVERFVGRARKVAEAVSAFPGEIWVAPHYDCDGISAAAVLGRALQRAGKRFRIRFLPRVSAEGLREIAESGCRLVIFLDIGSGYLEGIQKALVDNGCRVVVCDHHQPVGEVRSGQLMHLNPLEDGIAANISGAGVSYVLARAMSPENRDLAAFAIVGAIGDAQVGSLGADWGLFGLNKEMVKDAEGAGKLRAGKGLRLWGRYGRPLHKAIEWSDELAVPNVSESESLCVQFLKELGIPLQREDGGWRTLAELSVEEQQRLAAGIIKERVAAGLENPDWIFGDVYELCGMALPDANEFSTALNACGKTGSPWKGVAACWDSGGGIEETKERYRKQLGAAFRWLSKEARKLDAANEGGSGPRQAGDGAVKKLAGANAVFAGAKVSEHLLSNAASMLHRSGVLPDKALIAFADAEGGMCKVSARASDKLVAAGVDLSKAIAAAARHCGGQGGGHKGAAGATIPKGAEEQFLEVAVAVLGQQVALLKAPVHERGDGKARDSSGAAAESEGRSEAGGGAAQAIRAAAGRGAGAGKKVERQGLVQYFGS
ncbi:MAG TPA: DHH family phosphoesterase [archaeon]|nr:DHH family phosphoesterase [archaeon]